MEGGTEKKEKTEVDDSIGFGFRLTDTISRHTTQVGMRFGGTVAKWVSRLYLSLIIRLSKCVHVCARCYAV